MQPPDVMIESVSHLNSGYAFVGGCTCQVHLVEQILEIFAVKVHGGQLSTYRQKCLGIVDYYIGSSCQEELPC